MSNKEWERVVAFVGDETFRNGGYFIESKNGTERRYKPDVPQAQETIASGAARRVTATQIDWAA